MTTNERRAIARAILLAFDENYSQVQLLIRALNAELPAVPWKADLEATAASWQPFIDRRLSINWWTNEATRS